MTKKKNSKRHKRCAWPEHSLLVSPKPHCIAIPLYDHVSVYVGEVDIQNSRYYSILQSGLSRQTTYQLFTKESPILYVSDVRYYNKHLAFVSMIGGDKNLFYFEYRTSCKSMPTSPEFIYLPQNNLLANKNIYIQSPSLAGLDGKTYIHSRRHSVNVKHIEAIATMCGATIKRKLDKTVDLIVHEPGEKGAMEARKAKKAIGNKKQIRTYEISSFFGYLKQKLLEAGY